MATKRKYRQQYLRWHKGYEKRALKILRRVFHEYGKSIDLKGVTPLTLETHLKEKAPIELLYKAYAEIYTEIGIIHKARVLKGLNLSKKDIDLNLEKKGFLADVIAFLARVAGDRIVSVHKSYIESIRKLIYEDVEDDWTVRDMAKAITDLINKKLPWNKPRYYRWQSERIARTETTSSSNYAAIQAADDTGFVMVKEWISAHDDRVRRFPREGVKGQPIQGDLWDHVEMDGVQVPRYAKFEMENRDGIMDGLDYPGDIRGSAGNVINCRCAVALIGKRDENGNLIPTF